ncbi:MAG: S8 family serine peptidase, partial [Nanoarchaeota archaeon]
MKLRHIAYLLFVTILLSTQVFASDHNLELINRVLKTEDSIQNIEDLEEDYYIIDIDEYPVSPEINKKLEKATRVINYIPNSFFIIKADKNQVKRLKESGIVKRIWKYTSEYNYDPILQDSQNENINLQIILFDSSDLNEVLTKLSELGTLTYSKDNLVIINTNQLNIQEISNIKGVEFITQLSEATATNDLTNVVNGNQDFRNFWKLYGNDQVIAVGDTGIDTGINNPTMHDDFEGRINSIINWAASNGIGYYGLTCPPVCSTTSADYNGHGTHVSGSALGDGNKSGSNPLLNIYTNSYAGSAPKSNLVFLDIGDDNPNSNSLYPGSMTEYFTEEFLNNAKISSNSWNFQSSSTFNQYTSESFFADAFSYSNKDFLIVFTTGNTGPGTINPPATAKNVIAVGGNNKNNINLMYTLTATGPTADGRIKPDLIAPALNTISTRSSVNGNSNGCASNGINQFYSTCSGTSMATPVIAGLSALAKEYFIKVKGIQPITPLTPSSALIKASLINGAEDMGFGIPSFTSGWGRAN